MLASFPNTVGSYFVAKDSPIISDYGYLPSHYTICRETDS
jgi:hypothetical protein